MRSFLVLTVSLPMQRLRSFHQGVEKELGSQELSGSMGGMWRYLPKGVKYQVMLVLESTHVLGSLVSGSNQCVMSWPAALIIGSHSGEKLS